ncbi:Wall-associated receptor kinase C-terminal [Arabidopsis suecica]|uniref:non-specific serine/threonine protein kinase n=1 Tax=Arabidopsis suecica TaxID=45249 RepID=A0A8T1YQ56_ARASU|nr:Wall-associated receptor kinase C-terminal [Arabidopsis suecica]
MFSPLLFRFGKPNPCLVLLFLSYIHFLACVLSQREPICDTLFRCGNLTAGFPFWGESRPETCGHPSLVLHCHQNKTDLIISGQKYRVLQIDKTSNSLRLARDDFLGESFCSATFTSTTVTPELFELLPDYTNLYVYYGCNARFQDPVNFTCPKIGVASVHRDNNYHENCGSSFKIIVPRSYVPQGESLNVTNLQNVIKEGFEVKLRINERPCQECKSSGGVCAYRVATPVCCNCKAANSSSEPKCTPMIPSVYERCFPTFRCGKQTDLYYPFWKPDREECGHPEFKVNCNGDFAEFNISFVKFQILEMNHESRIIRLARMDYPNNLCPRDPESALINQHILPFSNDTELLTFFYECPGPRVDFPPGDYIRQLQCGDTTDEQSYFVRKELSSSYELVGAISSELMSSCKRTIDIPVSRSALKATERNQSLETLKKALDKGFKLRFNNDCSRCLTSGGTCGYNLLSRKFVCYCIDETAHTHTCGKKDISSTDIGIGLACGILGVTLVAGCLRFIIQKRGSSQHLKDHNLKGLLQLKQYSYAEVKKITKSCIFAYGWERRIWNCLWRKPLQWS